jgi:hypothetical protein
MGSKNTIGPLANLQVKADGHEKRKSKRKYKIAYRKKPKSFLQPSFCSGGSRVASGGRMLPRVTSGVTVCSEGVTCGLRWSWVALGVMDGLVGLQMASRAVEVKLVKYGPNWSKDSLLDSTPCQTTGSHHAQKTCCSKHACTHAGMHTTIHIHTQKKRKVLSENMTH